jgi:rhodanese-related sulfurtransferase
MNAMTSPPRFSRLVAGAKNRVQEISVEQLREKQGWGEARMEVVDVRDDADFRAGHIPGARHLPRGALERDIESAIPDTAGEVVLYCEGGLRSVLAADTLRQMGYAHALSLAGGWSAWLSEGGDVER